MEICPDCGHGLMEPAQAGTPGDDSYYCEGCGRAWDIDLILTGHRSAPTHYRGFRITFSGKAFNARPTADTLAGHPRLYPIAARTMEELTPSLDMMIEMYATKVISPAL